MTSELNISHVQLAALFKVTQKISSQLNLAKLLDEIMDLAIDLLHAEKGLILLRESDQDDLSVKAARAMNKQSIDDVVAMSRSIVRKAEAEGKSVLLEKVPSVPDPASSESLLRYKIKSVVCVPLKAKKRLIGTIYLDTTQSEHFFKKEDLPFLEAFANLAGLAIENAKSYEEIDNLNTNLERLVKERTVELEQKNQALEKANQELKTAQLQLVRSEKMASLGMLVAGVAHEINTPIGAINSNTDTIKSAVEKLREKFTSSQGDDKQLTKTLDMLQSVSRISKTACERMARIVRNLRNFARLDEEEHKSVDLHEGIDSTLSLIDHLRGKDIEIKKEYGELPKLRCYASQINQVFMNLLVNACQAIEGKGRITIRTYYTNGDIHIQFQDTGKGIPKHCLEKIFDPGFTTKGVGVGTGLGLSISYKIVEEHNGRIDVDSHVGTGTTVTLSLPVNKDA
ncbi:ATP-binding protein [bacterium]|nr:ATP-binding protein [bacterium]